MNTKKLTVIQKEYYLIVLQKTESHWNTSNLKFRHEFYHYFI